MVAKAWCQIAHKLICLNEDRLTDKANDGQS